MRPIRLDALSGEQLRELDHLYHTTRDVRVRTRAQMVLLAAEQGLVAAQIAALVRQHEETVRRWLVRYAAEGIAGLADAPRAGAPPKITREYRERLLQAVRQRPRGLGLPFSLWTAARLADYLAEMTKLRLSPASVCRVLRASGHGAEPAAAHDHQPGPRVRAQKRRSRRPATA